MTISFYGFLTRAVFGTTEEDNGGGLREWHNGAGEIYKPYNFWWLVVFLDAGFLNYILDVAK